ncbi:MAG: hypothetical protein R2830_19370 [Saprospiraceae bacterium]
MKNLSLLVFLLLSVLMTSELSATILRVNNNPGATAEYSNFDSAQNAAVSGDTIYMEPSQNVYGTASVFKKLTIIGNGYYLDENAGLQANSDASMMNNIKFLSGSDGSVVMGMTFTVSSNNANVHAIEIQASEIKIIRNKFRDRIFINGDTLSNIFVLQNYQEPDNTYLHDFIYDETDSLSNLIILNNITSGGIIIQATSNGVFIFNNVLHIETHSYTAYSDVNNSIVRNNILTQGFFYNANCIIQNNLCNSNQFPPTNGNQQNIDMNTVFLYNGSTDGQYQLKAGSPAIGAGYYNGEDCGAFDVPPGYGYVPYKLSGIPSIPSIYLLNAAITSDTLNVTISTRSNN